MATLSLETGPPLPNPSTEVLADALARIPETEGAFAILETEQGYVQAAAQRGGGLVLEYKRSDSSTLHRLAGQPVSVLEAAEAFEAFRWGDLSWIEKYPWEAEDLPASGGKTGCLGSMLFVVLMVGATIAGCGA